MRQSFFHLTASFFLLSIYQAPSLALEDCEAVFTPSSVFRNGETAEQADKPFNGIGASDLLERKKRGENILGRSLNQNETSALEEAHLVGQGEKGKDGRSAGIGNYTESQIREKTVILKRAGFSEEERRKLMEAGVVGWWKFWQKPKMSPPTDIIDELNEESTKVFSRISTYRASMIEYGNKIFFAVQNYPDFFEGNNHMRNIGDSYYWTRYVPGPEYGKKDSPDEGQFIIGFAMKVRSSYGDRAGWWHHRLHWTSRARDKQLDQETIKEIFQEIYGGEPEEVITEFQDKYVSDKEEVHEKAKEDFLYPFLYDQYGGQQKKQEVKETIQKAVNRRGSQTVSENTP